MELVLVEDQPTADHGADKKHDRMSNGPFAWVPAPCVLWGYDLIFSFPKDSCPFLDEHLSWNTELSVRPEENQGSQKKEWDSDYCTE